MSILSLLNSYAQHFGTSRLTGGRDGALSKCQAACPQVTRSFKSLKSCTDDDSLKWFSDSAFCVQEVCDSTYACIHGSPDCQKERLSGSLSGWFDNTGGSSTGSTTQLTVGNFAADVPGTVKKLTANVPIFEDRKDLNEALRAVDADTALKSMVEQHVQASTTASTDATAAGNSQSINQKVKKVFVCSQIGLSFFTRIIICILFILYCIGFLRCTGMLLTR
jgi:hypothetical protein